MHPSTDVLILGGGVSGLAAAGRLKKAGLKTTVLEKENEPGGLSRTARAGRFSFDLGGHRLYFSRPETGAWTEELLKGRSVLRHRRKSAVFTGGRMLRYPPTFLNGLLYAAPVLLSRGRRAATTDHATLKSWLETHLGPRIHDRYFRDYTRKVWGIGTDELSALWAERRIGGGFSIKTLLMELFGGKLSSKENTGAFIYPENGIGELPAAMLSQAGTELITGAQPLQILFSEGRPSCLVYSRGGARSEIRFRALLSTIPLQSLLTLLPRLPGTEPSALRYRPLVVLFAALRGRKPFPYHWVYYPDKNVPFCRTCELSNWSRLMAPEGWMPLTFEFFCDKTDAAWTMSAKELLDLALASPAMRGLPAGLETGELAIERLEHAYPLLYSGAEVPLAAIKTALAAFPNIHLCGRTGGHSYMDTEECLLDSWAAADRAEEIMQCRKPAASK